MIDAPAVPWLLILLPPCSITVSALQIATTGGLTLDPMHRRFLVIIVPAVLVATLVTPSWGSPSHIRLEVEAMLIISALLRLDGAHRRSVGASYHESTHRRSSQRPTGPRPQRTIDQRRLATTPSFVPGRATRKGHTGLVADDHCSDYCGVLRWQTT